MAVLAQQRDRAVGVERRDRGGAGMPHDFQLHPVAVRQLDVLGGEVHDAAAIDVAHGPHGEAIDNRRVRRKRRAPLAPARATADARLVQERAAVELTEKSLRERGFMNR